MHSLPAPDPGSRGQPGSPALLRGGLRLRLRGGSRVGHRLRKGSAPLVTQEGFRPLCRWEERRTLVLPRAGRPGRGAVRSEPQVRAVLLLEGGGGAQTRGPGSSREGGARWPVWTPGPAWRRQESVRAAGAGASTGRRGPFQRSRLLAPASRGASGPADRRHFPPAVLPRRGGLRSDMFHGRGVRPKRGDRLQEPQLSPRLWLLPVT